MAYGAGCSPLPPALSKPLIATQLPRIVGLSIIQLHRRPASILLVIRAPLPLRLSVAGTRGKYPAPFPQS
jgi:hypothetical protein